MNTCMTYFLALIFQLAAQDREGCEDRHRNIWLSALQQGFFGAANCLICAEAIATLRAVVSGIIGGKTWSFIFISYGLPIVNVGLTIFLFGDDYGKDPRCFIGWENQTKHVFFIQHLVIVGV
jgi:hypothetical protein